ncbi:MAG: DNA primase, partial [Candidatus Cloacimonetes bacterium]|nr:DNA primase [Candidatus Cloacimonadota bacterium]
SGGTATKLCAEEMTMIGWYKDSRSLLASKNRPGQRTALYKVPVGNPDAPSMKRPREIAGFGDSFSTLSPDNKTIVFCRRGKPYREKYRGSTNGELWSYDIKSQKYTKLTNTELTERYPQYSSDGKSVYYAASDGTRFQIFRADNGDFENPVQCTYFKDIFSPRDLSVSTTNRVVYEYFDRLGIYDASTGKTRLIDITINQDIYKETRKRSKRVNDFKQYSVSPDGKWVAFQYKFDLFAVPLEGGETLQLTHDQQGIDDISIMDDNQTIFFSKMVDGHPELFKVNIAEKDKIESVNWFKGKYVEFHYTQPGDNLIIHYSDGEDRYLVAMIDSTYTKVKSLIDDCEVSTGFSIHPDLRYALYRTTRNDIYTYTLNLYDFETEKSKPLFTHNSWFSGLEWGKDNASAFITMKGDIYRLDLQAKDDFPYAKDYWKDILDGYAEEKEDKNDTDDKDDDKNKKNKKKTPRKKDIKELEIDLDDMKNRITPIVEKEGYNWVEVVKNDSLIYYVNNNDETYDLRSVNYFGKNDKSLKTLKKTIKQFEYNKESGLFFYIKSGRLCSLNPKSGKIKKYSNDFFYEYDETAVNRWLFHRVWTEFGKSFYDPEMQGVNWKKLKKKLLPYLAYVDRINALEAIVDEMIGEVNASHTGFYPRKSGGNKWLPVATLGCEFDYKDYTRKGIRFSKISSGSKLSKPFGIKAGDVLLSVNGTNLDSTTPLMPLLVNQVGEKIELEIDTSDSVKVITIKGLSSDYDLYYDDWTAERKRKTDKLSNSRIGYIHIRRMSESSFEDFYERLWSENYDKEALVLDLRNNGGGHTHDKILSIFQKQGYAYSSSRTYKTKKNVTPRQIWQKPVILLINEDSFSDAEIFPHLFKHLKLGKVVGMPTSGSVIGTSSINFIDGSSMRMPRSGWYFMDKDGKPGPTMEGKGATPDIFVDPTPEQMLTDDDVQLQRAVRELLKEL